MGFSGLINQGLDQVNQQLISSQVDLQKLAVGDSQNLHQIMMNLEESRISFQLMMQVRNRLLEAYQDIMKMQI
jgi:flagellar hook-basal body complex protein FliE